MMSKTALVTRIPNLLQIQVNSEGRALPPLLLLISIESLSISIIQSHILSLAFLLSTSRFSLQETQILLSQKRSSFQSQSCIPRDRLDFRNVTIWFLEEPRVQKVQFRCRWGCTYCRSSSSTLEG